MWKCLDVLLKSWRVYVPSPWIWAYLGDLVTSNRKWSNLTSEAKPEKAVMLVPGSRRMPTPGEACPCHHVEVARWHHQAGDATCGPLGSPRWVPSPQPESLVSHVCEPPSDIQLVRASGWLVPADVWKHPLRTPARMLWRTFLDLTHKIMSKLLRLFKPPDVGTVCYTLRITTVENPGIFLLFLKRVVQAPRGSATALAPKEQQPQSLQT